MELSKLKSTIKEQFSGQKGLIAVLLYGSYAKGLARPDSDVDIAVLYEPGKAPSLLNLWKFKEIIEEKLNCDVDLVCLNEAGTIISSQIYKYHQPVLVNDQKKLDKYFMYLLAAYAELKEMRRPMEDHILERRKYYGRS